MEFVGAFLHEVSIRMWEIGVNNSHIYMQVQVQRFVLTKSINGETWPSVVFGYHFCSTTCNKNSVKYLVTTG